jgi:hypothetical protein
MLKNCLFLKAAIIRLETLPTIFSSAALSLGFPGLAAIILLCEMSWMYG